MYFGYISTWNEKKTNKNVSSYADKIITKNIEPKKQTNKMNSLYFL
jgi:hypothetical protein